MKIKYLVGLTVLFTISGSAAMANDYCKQREILEAQITVAKDYGVATKKALVQSFTPGVHTEALGNNAGFDTVTVVVTRGDNDPVIEAVRVNVKQIGTTSDCKILSVE